MLSPVPPDLSGPDQARFSLSCASRPRERLKHRGRNATTPLTPRKLAMLTTITPDSLATADPSRLLLYCQQISRCEQGNGNERRPGVCLPTDHRARVIDLIVATSLVLSSGCSKEATYRALCRKTSPVSGFAAVIVANSLTRA